eukprot:200590-Pyramimonas_sp.AAC.1
MHAGGDCAGRASGRGGVCDRRVGGEAGGAGRQGGGPGGVRQPLPPVGRAPPRGHRWEGGQH